MKKEKEERLANAANGQNYGTSPFGSRDFLNNSGPDRSGKHSTFHRSVDRSRRGGYAYAGRGYSSYHPYQRPQPPQFKNRTAVFNKPDLATDNSDANNEDVPVPNATHTTPSKLSIQPQSQPRSLCPALTSTGTFDATLPSILSFSCSSLTIG